MTKVSIIIPVYNVEKYLEECLESVVNQTLREIEIIAINDGSTDSSLSILEKYELRYNNFKIINQDNKGISAARNAGLRACSGKYIYFLDSDDFIDINAMEYCYKEAEKYNLDILTFDSKVFHDKDYKGEKSNESYTRFNKLDEKVMTGEDFYVYSNAKKAYKSTVWLNFYNTEYLKENNLYFYDGIVHEDEIYTLSSYLMAKRLKYIPKEFYNRRIRTDSVMTLPLSLKRIEGNYTVAEEFYRLIKILNLKEDTVRTIMLWINQFYRNAITFCDVLGLYDKRNFIKNKIKEKDNIMIDLQIQLDVPSLFYLSENS